LFPRSMPEAITRFKNSDFAQQWFGPSFVESFAATRQSQLDFFNRKVTDVELDRFFDLG
jgi:glutamine synthetase